MIGARRNQLFRLRTLVYLRRLYGDWFHGANRCVRRWLSVAPPLASVLISTRSRGVGVFSRASERKFRTSAGVHDFPCCSGVFAIVM
jgi:hypothetical protein